MKNINKFLLMCLLGTATVFSSCSKDDEPAPSKEALLTAKTWKQTAATINPGLPRNGTTITDYFAQMDACEKDDLLKFNANGSYTDDEGATKCNSSDPQVVSGTWLFNTDKTKITASYSGLSADFNNIEVSATTFKYTETHVENGINYIITNTWTAQ